MNRYAALIVISAIHKIMAVIIWIFAGVSVFAFGQTSPTITASLMAVGIVFGLALLGVGAFAFGELIDLAINVAVDVHSMATEEAPKPALA